MEDDRVGERPSLLGSAPLAITVLAALLATGICAWQLSVPGVLRGVTEYDDGVYLGAAVRFVSGVLPYRNFVFVQPPGIVVLMSPVALLGRLIGSADSLIIVRLVTALVAGANAGFTAWIVRRHGWPAMAIAGGVMAGFPLAVTADHTLMLEPYLVLFVLLGSVLAFNRHDPSARQLILAGMCFGTAGAVKLWAIFPFVALLASVIPLWRARVLPLLVGSIAGFGLFCVPFLISAPHAFVREVFADQLLRDASLVNTWSPGSRLAAIVGFPGALSVNPAPSLAIAPLVVIGCLVFVTYGIGRRQIRRPDNYVLLAAILSVAGLAAGPEFYRHYAYFSAPFLAALLATGVAGTTRALHRDHLGAESHAHLASAAKAFSVFCGLGALVLLIAESTTYASTYLPNVVRGPTGIVEPGSAIDKVIPQGSCVVFDEAILALEANRFSSAVPSCPQLVDPYGMWLEMADGASPPASPPFPPQFVARWKAYLEDAQYVILWVPESDFIPWTPSLLSWFNTHFTLIQNGAGSFVYLHTGINT